ncbi:hypothetical protein F4677DRAFT_415547 [Hypoxylon crocopeplum]|nr:hypothetical protein F4677DRAFT_415547 [Hypoxylon crocopeplum]
MCRWISIEICCADEFGHALPFTIKLIPLIICLCKDGFAVQKAEQAGSTRKHLSWISGQRCPRFDPYTVRCERIFWTTCTSCLQKQAAAAADFGEEDLRNVVAYNHLLVNDLAVALMKRPYPEAVKAFKTEFGIKERYVLDGSRWVEAPEGTEEDPLGPDPPWDNTLEGLEWWLEHGMGGEVHEELWTEFYNYMEPQIRAGRFL